MDQVWGWLGWLAAGLATIVAIRGSVRFDVTEWLKERRRQKEENLRLLCPHAVGEVDEGGDMGIRSTYVSPVGTTAHQCQMCGAVTRDRDDPERQIRYWVKNLDEFVERHKKMVKLAKKLGRG